MPARWRSSGNAASTTPSARRGCAEGGTGLIVWTETLAGREIERRVPGRAIAKNMAVTPGKNCLCAQDDLEPVIRRHAEAAGPGELRFNTETDVVHPEGRCRHRHPDRSRHGSGDAVHRALSDRAPRARKAACAARSASKMVGEEKVYDSVNILFHADLTQWVKDRPAALYFVEQDDLRATFLTINGQGSLGLPDPQPEANMAGRRRTSRRNSAST